MKILTTLPSDSKIKYNMVQSQYLTPKNMKDVTIQVVDILSPALQQQTEKLRFAAFHKEKLTNEQKAKLADKYVFEEASFRFVIAFLEEKPVGYIRLFKRHIHCKDQVILLGGIGGVCTDPAYQKQGIATKMLTVAREELQKEKCAIAFLCTDIHKLSKFYGQIGFVPLNKAYIFTGRSGKKYQELDGMIAPINSSTIFQEVIDSKEAFDLEGQAW